MDDLRDVAVFVRALLNVVGTVGVVAEAERVTTVTAWDVTFTVGALVDGTVLLKGEEVLCVAGVGEVAWRKVEVGSLVETVVGELGAVLSVKNTGGTGVGSTVTFAAKDRTHSFKKTVDMINL